MTQPSQMEYGICHIFVFLPELSQAAIASSLSVPVAKLHPLSGESRSAGGVEMPLSAQGHLGQGGLLCPLGWVYML